MAFKIKSPSLLGEDFQKIYESKKGKNIPVVLLDTGALIDLEILTKNHRCDTVSFLSSIKSRIPLVVTPYIYGEIAVHFNSRRNGHIPKIASQTFGYVQRILPDSTDFITRVRTDVSSGDAGYDMYWVSKESCKYHRKKCNEDFSDVDRDTLTHAVRLSTSYIEFPNPGNPRHDVGPVIIFSPDQHMFEGVKFIRKFFPEYKNIENVSTRYKA